MANERAASLLNGADHLAHDGQGCHDDADDQEVVVGHGLQGQRTRRGVSDASSSSSSSAMEDAGANRSERHQQAQTSGEPARCLRGLTRVGSPPCCAAAAAGGADKGPVCACRRGQQRQKQCTICSSGI